MVGSPARSHPAAGVSSTHIPVRAFASPRLTTDSGVRPRTRHLPHRSMTGSPREHPDLLPSRSVGAAPHNLLETVQPHLGPFQPARDPPCSSLLSMGYNQWIRQALAHPDGRAESGHPCVRSCLLHHGAVGVSTEIPSAVMVTQTTAGIRVAMALAGGTIIVVNISGYWAVQSLASPCQESAPSLRRYYVLNA